MTISLEEPRCVGHKAGPSGHGVHPECYSCARRLAHRAWGLVKYIEPSKEQPCPNKITEKVDV